MGGRGLCRLGIARSRHRDVRCRCCRSEARRRRLGDGKREVWRRCRRWRRRWSGRRSGRTCIWRAGCWGRCDIRKIISSELWKAKPSLAPTWSGSTSVRRARAPPRAGRTRSSKSRISRPSRSSGTSTNGSPGPTTSSIFRAITL